MRTGAIFARGSCRALKWMALFGVVLFLLAGGEALAQPTSVTTHTMANAYSDQIVVLRFSDPVWGDVPLTAFSHSTATVTDVIGLQESGPGTRTFAIRVATSLATGALGTLTYTQPTEAARRLKTTDSGDADDDPDDVDTFEDQSVTEENNAPVLSESIMDVAVIPDETYDADDPVVELPKVMGASGFGTITYTLEGQATLPAGLVPVATGFDDPTHDDFGKIIGTVDEDVEHDVSVLTWTATDSDTPTENTGTTGRFRIVVQMVPGKPGTLTAAAGDGSVTLSWSAPTTGGPVTSYDYEQTAGGVTAGWMPAVGTTTDGMTVTLTVTGLTNGTDYDFRVRARNTAGPGDASTVVSATPAAAAMVPGMPGNVTATPGDGSVMLSWTPPTTGGGSITSYEYQQTAAGGAPTEWMTALGTTTGTDGTVMLSVTGLTNGTSYAFQVRARNAAGPGDPSRIASATPAAAAMVPGMPGSLTVVEESDRKVVLSWTAPTTGGPVASYEYEQTVNGVTAGWMSTEMGTATRLDLTGLTNGTRYIFRVRAVNTAGEGPASTSVTAIPVAAVVVPGMPGTLTAAPGNRQVTLSWTAPTTGGAVASYEYEQTAGGVTAGWMPVVGTTTGMTVTLTVTGLTNGTDYDFRVRARNTAGPGDASNIASATPAAGPNRTISRVSLGTIGEGGQAQATVTLNAPVGEGQFIRVKLRLVGKLHTRQNTPSGPQTGGPFSATPFRQSGGVRTYLSGELDTADYDADVAGELTIQAGQSSGQVTVYANTDDDAEDEILLLQAIPDNRMFNRNSDSISGLGGREALFHIMDSHTQGYALTAVPTKIYEAGNRATVSTVHFTPNFRRVDDLRTNVTLTSSHSSYSALFANGLNTMALPAGDAGVTAQFQLIPTRRPLAACSCDGDREDDDVVVNAVIRGEVVATTTIEVVDVHKLPKITVTATTESGAGPLTELAEGSKYKVLVEADRNNPSGEVTGETVRVRLALADSSDAMAEDFRITPSFRDISGSSNNQSSTFDLEVLAGDGDIGEEMLVLDATVQGRDSRSGTATETGGTLSVTLVDTTTLNVEPKTDAEVELAVTKARNESEGADKLWTAGDDDLSIMLGDLFKLPSTGFSISADAMSADADVVMAEANATGVTVKAVGPGTTKVTVTATTAATSVSTQVSANIATVAFEVMVDKLDLVLMLSGPEDMNLVEGMEAMLTVTANQKVAEDIEVMIMRDRSKSKAGEDDYDVGMLTIEAGEMSGTTMVMAVEDDMPEDMEELVLYAMAGDMEVDGEVMLYLWDAAVPALPIIAQLLLAGVLGIGGYRRYRRR